MRNSRTARLENELDFLAKAYLASNAPLAEANKMLVVIGYRRFAVLEQVPIPRVRG